MHLTQLLLCNNACYEQGVVFKSNKHFRSQCSTERLYEVCAANEISVMALRAPVALTALLTSSGAPIPYALCKGLGVPFRLGLMPQSLPRAHYGGLAGLGAALHNRDIAWGAGRLHYGTGQQGGKGQWQRQASASPGTIRTAQGDKGGLGHSIRGLGLGLGAGAPWCHRRLLRVEKAISCPQDLQRSLAAYCSFSLQMISLINYFYV